MEQITFLPREILSIIGGALLRQRLGAAGLAARVVRSSLQSFQKTLNSLDIAGDCAGEDFTGPLETALLEAMEDIPLAIRAAVLSELTPRNISELISTDDAGLYLDRQMEQFLEFQPDHALSVFPTAELVAQLRKAYNRRLRNRPPLPGCEGADFRGANLTNTDLSEADLTRACFANAILIYADLTASYLTDADLFGANFSGALLNGARMYGVNALGADFSGAEMNLVRLNGARLIGVHFNGASLMGADLSSTLLSAAVFADTNLTHADLTGADLSGADLSNADLTGASLRGANLCGALLPDGWHSKSQAKQLAHLKALKIPGLLL